MTLMDALILLGLILIIFGVHILFYRNHNGTTL
jgi:hypothetical protein